MAEPVVDSFRSTRCRVEFPDGIHVCYANHGYNILAKKLGPNWVIDSGLDEARVVAAHTFENKLREEGLLLVWRSKESALADTNAEDVAAIVFVLTPYVVETPQGKQKVSTLSAAGHIAASRGWMKITHASEQVPRLSKYEMKEFLAVVAKHDPRKVAPIVVKSSRPIVEGPPPELLTLLATAKEKDFSASLEHVFSGVDQLLCEGHFDLVDKMLRTVPLDTGTELLLTLAKVTIADEDKLPSRQKFLARVKEVMEDREDQERTD